MNRDAERARDTAFLAFLRDMGVGSGKQIQYRKWSGGETGGGEPTITSVTRDVDDVRIDWNIAWSAAMAAFEHMEVQRAARG